MKLLFLANRTPYPPYRGDKLKIYHLAKRLTARGHELHLLTFAQNAEDYAARLELEKIFTQVHLVDLPFWKSALHSLAGIWDEKPIQVLYFQDGVMRKMLDKIMNDNRFDVIHVQHLRMAPYLANNNSIPRILDLPDAFSLYWQRRKLVKKNFLKRIFEKLESKRVLQYEPILKSYNRSLVCSQEDLEYLQKTHQANNLGLLPNGVDLDTFKAENHNYGHNQTLLFTGNMDYAPNVDSVLYFCSEILPIIKQSFPDVVFVIAGQRPVDAVKNLATKGIEITGFVKNIASLYNAASVVVAPLRFGAGTQNKVLEAMAMGIPVVCSNIGFAGLGIVQGEGAFMETKPQLFAQKVIELLKSQDLRERVGQNGIRVINSRFGWDAIATTLENYFQELIKESNN